MAKSDKRSRYANVPIVTRVDSSGDDIRLLELRDIRANNANLTLVASAVDRLDSLAFRYYRDPTAFWRICDASDHLDPNDVVVVNQTVAIPPKK